MKPCDNEVASTHAPAQHSVKLPSAPRPIRNDPTPMPPSSYTSALVSLGNLEVDTPVPTERMLKHHHMFFSHVTGSYHTKHGAIKPRALSH
ncbi:hypothetical protein LIA77_07557 [Sarocladium implicatum]|nr:hypothetical protein LIA77_07557 [Sarocladium implicatum]